MLCTSRHERRAWYGSCLARAALAKARAPRAREGAVHQDRGGRDTDRLRCGRNEATVHLLGV